MDYRFLGRSGLKVPVLSFGTGTFGGTGPLFGAWGNTGATEARRLVDICLEAGVNTVARIVGIHSFATDMVARPLEITARFAMTLAALAGESSNRTSPTVLPSRI